MGKVLLRFYEELNRYLPPEKQKRDFQVSFEGCRTLGQILEGQGVPRGDVDLILVNGRSKGFGYVVKDGDRVSLYPVFERLDIGGVTNLRGRPLRKTRFVAEKDLAGVAECLRSLGFDILCNSGLGAEEAMELSRKERRILLTSRPEAAESGRLTRVLHVAAGTVEDRVRAIFKALHLDKEQVEEIDP